MTQTFLAFAIVLGALVPSPAQQTPATPPAGVSIEIDAVFVDSNGKQVRDITRDEVEVWIAGYRVPLEKFMAVTADDHERSRRSIVLLVDDITVDPALMPRVREAGKALIAGMTDGDEMAIISLSGDTTATTTDAAALLRTLDRYSPRASGFMRPDTLGEQVLRTIATISRQLAESGGRKRTIVGLGSGWLFDTPLPPAMASGRELGPEWVDAMRAMSAANVTLYVIDPGGVGRSRLPAGDSGFARETGGFAFMNTNDVRRAAAQILDAASNYYILGVSDPPMFRSAPLREVDVRVKRRGVTVRARRGLAGGQAPSR
jgi:VWFA-related protein